MRKNLYRALACLLVITGIATTIHLNAQQQKQSEPQKPVMDCPMMKKHEMAGMHARGEQGMGFSQTKTTHHFYLTKTGGVIQVEANDSQDTVSRDKIREHLRHIAMMFAEGNFDIPMFVHDRAPEGVVEMKRLKTVISYKYEETKGGGRVLISTDDAQALSAVQSFLRFQITEHETGDSLKVDRE